MKAVYVIDDHAAVRQNYGLLITREQDMVVCGEAASADEALVGVVECNPDLIVLDISLQGEIDGVELLKRLHADRPDLPILVVSGHDEVVYADRMLRLGARGYVMKGDALLFMEALRQVAAGQTFVNPQVRGDR